MMSRDVAYGSSHVTGWIFLEYCNTGAQVFNNVLEADADAGKMQLNYPANGYITEGGPNDTGSTYYWNNTIVSARSGGICIDVGYSGNTVNVYNNLLDNCGAMIAVQSGVTMNIDYNLYFQTGGTIGPWIIGNAQYHTFSSWKTGCKGCDSHTQSGNDPKLDGSYHLPPGSAAIQQGANLTNLGVPALDLDRAGVARPGGSCSGQGSGCNWDEGIYQFSNNPPPKPPTGLTATVQ
jgi:hypothetical protein